MISPVSVGIDHCNLLKACVKITADTNIARLLSSHDQVYSPGRSRRPYSIKVLAKLTASDRLIGQNVSHSRIVEKLGSGPQIVDLQDDNRAC